jgi:phage gp45-like
MRHSTSRTSADRHASGLGRTVLTDVDDTKLMQESTHALFNGEQQQRIEHVHPYGFTAVPQKPTGTGVMRRAAEAFMSFLGGNRSHGIAIAVGDRRYRLYKLDYGEVALHDDQGQQVHFKRNGIWGSVPNSKMIRLQIMDDNVLPQDSSDSGGPGAEGAGGSGGGSQPMGQIQQAGRPARINLTLDANQFTLNHPNGTVNFNCATLNITASQAISQKGGTITAEATSGAVTITSDSSDVTLNAPRKDVVTLGVTTKIQGGGASGIPSTFTS